MNGGIMDLKLKFNSKYDGKLIVCLIGSLDTETSVQFEQELRMHLKDDVKGIMLDMEKLEYISSVGFGVIFKAKQEMEKKNGTLAIANLQPKIQTIFNAVKAVPESVFATIRDADEYLDNYIANIFKNEKKS